jgi:FkbM family methyltransferase
MWLEPGDEIHDSIAYTGLYEMKLTRRFLRHARTSGLLVDVGANYGYFALLWAAANSSNRVIAFEASPRNVPGLRRNVEENRFADRIRVEACAASQHAGEIAFDLGPAQQTGWGGAAASHGVNTVRVPAVRLDDVLADEARIDVLKIDVEGAEAWVLAGADRLLREQRVRQIYFETNKPRLSALGLEIDASEKILRAAGYEITPLDDPDAEVAEFSAAPRRT